MTTATLHAHVQRTRFTHLTLAALASVVPTALRRLLPPVEAASALSRTASASLEAQKVRELASTYARTDPGFAADLYAAAARHEALHEA